jgi:hypothetical protein
MTYGNLINRIIERSPSQPVVGEGATICAYSDRYAGTVYSVSSHKRPIVTVQEDAFVRTDGLGFSDSQTYEYSRDPSGRRFYFRQDQRGVWREIRKNHDTNRWIIVSGGSKAIFGYRDKRHDFSF